AIAVEAMKAGASDFLEKPFAPKALIAAIDRALALAHDGQLSSEWREAAVSRLTGLTPRQHQIMDMILAGNPNKNIAADLGISQRTVENHRAAIMKRTGATSLPDLARMVVAADAPAGQ
ncbi:MAG: LuxR C-terminal-related transcriptional regulator, partial [Ancalomicrobiaceae bacterium]|nr:LuxR C-terminal-related transcriptional regulator [Ancalomicrobiaceae bacterium]